MSQITEIGGQEGHGDHLNCDNTTDCAGRHCGSGPGCAERHRDGGSCACKCFPCLTVAACVGGDAKPRLMGLGTLEDISRIVEKARSWHDAVDDCEEGNAEDNARVEEASDALFDAIEESRINPRHR